MRWVCISANWDRGAAVDMAVGTEHQPECWTHYRETSFIPHFQPFWQITKLENLSQTNLLKIQKGNEDEGTAVAFLFCFLEIMNLKRKLSSRWLTQQRCGTSNVHFSLKMCALATYSL